MGKLLDNLGKWESAVLWKPAPNDGVEGIIIATKRHSGKFDSTWFLLQCDDGNERIIGAPDGSSLAKKINAQSPCIGDTIAVLFRGKTDGFNNWELSIEHTSGADISDDAAEVANDDLPF
jgi:hypothetical protein